MINYMHPGTVTTTVTMEGKPLLRCEYGWYGNGCDEKCHCRNRSSCYRYGVTCNGVGECDDGWFGPDCQYIDLVKEATFVLPTVIIPDHSDGVEPQYQHSYYYEWSSVFLFTWAQVNIHGVNIQASIQVSESDNTPWLKCPQNYFVSNVNNLNLYCGFEIYIKRINITISAVSPFSVKAIHISGGRELQPLKQPPIINTHFFEGQTQNGLLFLDLYFNESFYEQTCRFLFHNSVLVNRYEFLLHNKVRAITLESFPPRNSQRLLVTQNSLGPGPYMMLPKDNAPLNEVVITFTTIEPLTDCRGIRILGDNTCPDGFYSSRCDNQCICPLGQCWVSTGDCKINKTTESVTQLCPWGYYGEGCDLLCPVKCDDNGCDPISGHCSGCQPGYFGDTCHEICNLTYYGSNCQNRCSSQCYLDFCTPNTGHCLECPSGKKGILCEQDCSDGYYGRACSGMCPENCPSDCEKASGHCLICSKGYQGSFCDRSHFLKKILIPHHLVLWFSNDECDPGTFGQNCSAECPKNCLESICDHKTGLCSACKPGYKGNQCTEACEPGKYGVNCFSSCPLKCQNGCDGVSGMCGSCQAGYSGSFCDE
ncbi:multiple epidermal growth factor domains protein 11, partial [Biomphalaria glabrata]